MNLKPSSKTVATAAAGSIVTIAVWGIGLAGIDVPAETATAAAALIAILIAWLAPATSGKYVDTSTDDFDTQEGTFIGDFEDIDEDPNDLIVDDTPTAELTERDLETIADQEKLDQALATEGPDDLRTYGAIDPDGRPKH